MSSVPLHKRMPAIPDPVGSPASQRDTLLALKESAEIVSGMRGPSPFVTWEDLVRLGLISEQDVPRR